MQEGYRKLISLLHVMLEKYMFDYCYYHEKVHSMSRINSFQRKARQYSNLNFVTQIHICDL